VSSELENKQNLLELKQTKQRLEQKKINLKNKLNMLEKNLENDQKKFQTIEEFHIKRNKEKIDFLNSNKNFLMKLHQNMEETGDPMEFKNKHWRKI
jgi:hypothetical protein